MAPGDACRGAAYGGCSARSASGLGSGVLARAREGTTTGVPRGVVELFLDAEQLVVLRDPLGPRRGTGLDLAAVRGDREVRDGGVLCLPGTVAHHAPEPVAVREVH